MAILTKKEILDCQDSQSETVHVPGWGGDVIVASMTGAERDKWEFAISGGGRGKAMDLTNFRAKLVALCCVDESGDRLFSEEDIEALGRKSAASLSLVFDVAQRINALTKADVEELSGN